MQTATAQKISEWEVLERDYRKAWEALTQQVGVWSSFPSDPTSDCSDAEARCNRLKLLEDRYHQARDRLADYMLASLQKANSGTETRTLDSAVQVRIPAAKAVVRKSVFSLSLGCA
jgi:hypothetical protein